MLRRPETKEVARFLYDLLVTSAPTRDYAKRVAERMNVPYPSLARYWQGHAAFPAGLVRSLFRATDYDMRVAEMFLLEGTDYKLERKDPTDVREAEIQRAVMHLNILEGEISRIYLQATDEESDAGSRISFGEARELEQALRRLTRTTEALRSTIKGAYLRR